MTVKYDVWIIVNVLVLWSFFYLECQCQEVGSSCTVGSTGEQGICKISNECPKVEEQAKRGINPTVCGFHQLIIPIVCCENEFNSFPSPNDLAIGGDSFAFPVEDTPNLQGNSFFGGAAKKSEQKCLEYTRATTDVVHATPLVTHVESIAINVTKCGLNSVALIVGGSPAAAGEFPFVAAIGFPSDEDEPQWRCGGSLVSEKWVLTAAHCTFSRDGGEPRWVRLGELDLSRTDESEHKDYNIDKILAHPEYKYPQKYNDIALLSLTQKVEFTKFIRPACLYTKSRIQQKIAIATGWGQTVFSGQNSDELLKVQLNIYDRKVCERVFRNEIRGSQPLSNGIVKSMLCVGELQGGKDTCLGDSGGPLFITEKENLCKFYIIGITSFGKLCAQNNTAAIYTKVSEYIDWIENTIW